MGRVAATPRPGIAPLDQLSFDIGRAYHNYKLLLERTLRKFGLDRHVRAGMGHILFALFENDDCNIKEIVARTQLSFPTITVLLGQMEKTGLIERRRDRQDGRAVRVRLTPLTRSLEPKCHQVVRRLNDVIQQGMSRAEVRRLRDLIARMIRSMREDEASDDRAPRPGRLRERTAPSSV
jgi:DNA-binding MarR family transcriptional regulator